MYLGNLSFKTSGPPMAEAAQDRFYCRRLVNRSLHNARHVNTRFVNTRPLIRSFDHPFVHSIFRF